MGTAWRASMAWAHSRLVLHGLWLAVAVAVTTACASASGILSEEQARQYVGLGPFDFVAKRFFEDAQTPTLDRIDDGVKSLSRFFDRVDPERAHIRAAVAVYAVSRKPELNRAAMLVTWPAYFSNQNFVQLARPAAELRRYCLASGGTFALESPYQEDPVALLNADPIATFVDTHQRVMRHLAAGGVYVGFEEMRSVIAADVGAEMAQEAREHNRRVQQLFAVNGFRSAQQLDAFGVFSCDMRTGPRWLASVLPSTWESRDPSNQLDSSMMRLAIRVYGSK